MENLLGPVFSSLVQFNVVRSTRSMAELVHQGEDSNGNKVLGRSRGMWEPWINLYLYCGYTKSVNLLLTTCREALSKVSFYPTLDSDYFKFSDILINSLD